MRIIQVWLYRKILFDLITLEYPISIHTNYIYGRARASYKLRILSISPAGWWSTNIVHKQYEYIRMMIRLVRKYVSIAFQTGIVIGLTYNAITLPFTCQSHLHLSSKCKTNGIYLWEFLAANRMLVVMHT